MGPVLYFRGFVAGRCHLAALVVTTGTFLNGLVHVGDERRPAGRADEPPTRPSRMAE